ncbi:MAG TPA: class I SAM-dependent methyltransferase, partial [Ramlibacter sp.]
GVDADEGMLAACRAAGLDVQAGDALEYLRAQGNATAAVVSAFHVAEHLPFDKLRALVGEALRVLAPGGLLVLETPNPENLVVGSSAFYMDPTHERPLPPLLLGFVAEFAGFTRVATLRLHEGLAQERPVALIDVLAGVSPDYAVVAQKPGPASAALDTAFAAKHGVNLNDLAQRWERQLQDWLREVQVSAGMAREGMIGLAMRVEALERERAVQSRLEQPAAEKVIALEEQLHALRASSSWRITAPLRSARDRLDSLRGKGAGHVARALARWLVLEPARALNRLLHRRAPRVRSALARVAHAFGLGPAIRAAARPAPPPPPLDRATMSADAQRALDALRSAAPAALRKDD